MALVDDRRGERSDEPADRSPWERDDWEPVPFVPDWSGSESVGSKPAPSTLGAAEPAPDGHDADPGPPPAGASTSRGPGRRRVFAAGAVLLVALGAVVVLRGAGSDDTDPAADAAQPVDLLPDGDLDDADEGAAGADGDTASESDPGAEPVGGSTPVTIGPDTDPPVTRATDADDRDQAAGDPPPPITQVVHDEVPIWSVSSIEVPPPLASMPAATDVFVLTSDEILHHVEFPSGRVRSIGVDAAGPNPLLVVGERAVVLYLGNRLMIIPDEERASVLDVGDGVIFVQARPNSDQFIVTTPAPSATVGEQDFVLSADGRLDPAGDGPFVDAVFWARSFLPSGELVVNGPGGVYSIDDADVASRISDGDLVATGTNHYAVQECDATFVCGGWIVEAETGERTPAVLDEVATEGFLDPSTRISPDGGSIVYRDNTRGTGVRRIVATATGAGVDVGRSDAIVYTDAWAADSSGLFDERSGDLRFQFRDSAEVVVFEEFGAVVNVGARAAR